MNSPNILINNFCNQGCTYCFAEELMRDKKIPREMSIEDFKALIKKLKKSKNKFDTVKLLGGEPTLHSKFKDIVKITMDNFNYVQIFTNGLFSEDIFFFLKSKAKRLRFTFNIMTPSFRSNEKVRHLITKRISQLADYTEAALSITIDPFLDIQSILATLDTNLVKKTQNVRVGASNPILGKKNIYKQSDFPKMGKNVYKLIQYLVKINPKINVHLDCGFTPCMFTATQLNFIQKNCIDKNYWGCYLGNMDIQTNGKTIVCYPLSTQKTIDTQKEGIDKIENKLTLNQYVLLNKYQDTACKKCRFFGFEKNQCSGFCIAFLINQQK